MSLPPFVKRYFQKHAEGDETGTHSAIYGISTALIPNEIAAPADCHPLYHPGGQSSLNDLILKYRGDDDRTKRAEEDIGG